MLLTGRENELATLATRADSARAGRGGLVVVTGESGAGKTAFVEAFVDQSDVAVWWGACDPLSTPRPLGPFHDLSAQLAPRTTDLLRDGELPHQIFGAVFDDLRSRPTVLVVDDLHWADQATIDLLRFVLRRIASTQSLVVGMMRDDDLGTAHPMRSLLGDVARSPNAETIALAPLSLDAVTTIVGDRPVDPAWLHWISAGNAFFVVEMLDHVGGELPTTVRDAILARTVGLDGAAWDLLHLLACAPEAIPDRLLPHLGVTLPALRAVADANLLRRSDRGIAFRHDLCRQAIASVIPAGAEGALHRRMLLALDATPPSDPAVLTHHALGAGDQDRIARAATDAGRAAARSGAHTQACEFYRTALEHGGPLPAIAEAELLELLATECYLTDRLDEAIATCRRAMHLREQSGAAAALSADHHALAVYQWYNADRAAADRHVEQAISVLAGETEPAVERAPADGDELAQLGHAFAMQAYLAMQSNDLEQASALVARASEIAGRADDPSLVVRTQLIVNLCAVLRGKPTARATVLSIVGSGHEIFDEIHSSGYSNLTYFDVEQRRLGQAADLLEVSLALTVERDLPICRVWQLGARGRLNMMLGEWDEALTDADRVLGAPSAPLARTWPLLIRALVALRRDGDAGGELDEAWRLACGYGEPIRLLPAAAAIAERAWLTGVPDERVTTAGKLLASRPTDGLEWARGELATWLHRLGAPVDADGVAAPYRLVLDGSSDAAADAFERLSSPYDAALALVDAGDADHARRALDILDRLGATAVAAKVRRDLRATGTGTVPARRRSATLGNPAGLTVRQVEVLQAMHDGATNAELAARLYLSPKTVDHHVSAILSKLQVTNRRDAVRRARELGIIS